MLVHHTILSLKRLQRARLTSKRTIEAVRAEQALVQSLLQSLSTEAEQIKTEKEALEKQFPFLKELFK